MDDEDGNCGSLTCRWSRRRKHCRTASVWREVMDRLDTRVTASSYGCAFSAGRTQSETARDPRQRPRSRSPAASASILAWMREQLLRGPMITRCHQHGLDPCTAPLICTPAFNRHHPNIHLAQHFSRKLCRNNPKNTCKNLLTKVILLAIIIKLSREPSSQRQPLEPLPTACYCTFFEENFFKKLSENLLTNEKLLMI